MKRSTMAALAATASLGVFALGVTGAEAYQKYSNAAVAMTDGATASIPSLASAFCDAKGFAGAQDFKFSGFQSNGGSVKAVFKTIKCTMVASLIVDSDGTVAGSQGFHPSASVKKAINDSIKDAEKKDKIGKSLSKHHKVH